MPEENNKSPYQEGNLQLNRLNSLQEKINEVNLNLRVFDEEIQGYNYNIKFNLLNTLFSEVSARCSEKEKKLAKKFEKGIPQLMLTNSPHRPGSIAVGGLIRHEIKFYQKDFDILKKILFGYELIIKELLHKYFRSSLDKEQKPKEF